MRKSFVRIWVAMCVAAVCVAAAMPAPAQIAQTEVDEFKGVGITEKLKDQIPLDLAFTDEDGKSVTLKDYFDGVHPVLLTLIYFDCPMLCTVVLNGLVESLKQISLTPGSDFQMLTISFNPLDTPALARLKKENYLKELGEPGAGAGWHFLTGRADPIKKITDAVGFGYRWNEKQKAYAHSAAIMILTPDGRLSRYMYGVEFDPKTLKLSLIDAAKGKIGTPLDQVILYCFHYDPASGSYVPMAMNLMRAGGVIMVLVIAGIVLGVVFAKARVKNGATSGASGGRGK